MKKNILLLLLIGLLSTSHAQSWMNFNTTNGLSDITALSVMCDSTNRIWVSLGGNYPKGIDVFDGTSWINYDTSSSGLPSNWINYLATDQTGNVWIATNQGLVKYDGANWTVYDTNNSGLPANNVASIHFDANNEVWISDDVGLTKFDGTTFTSFPHSYPGRVFVQDSAHIWVAGVGLDLFNPFTGIWRHFEPSNSTIPGENLTGILRDANGLLWMGFNFGFNGGIGNGGSNGGLATYDGSTFTAIWPFQNHYTGVYGLHVDALNNIWVSTSCEGLYRFDGSTWSHVTGPPAGGCSNSGVTSDSQNSIWYPELYSGVWTGTLSVGSAEPQVTEAIKVFPNPAHSSLHLSLKGAHGIQVYDAWGKLLLEKVLHGMPDQMIELDVASLPSGIFFLHAGSESARFVKE
jgi:hypothetical protein